MSSATHLPAWSHHPHLHLRWPPEWTGAVMAVVLALLVLVAAGALVVSGTPHDAPRAPSAPAPGPPVQPGTALR